MVFVNGLCKGLRGLWSILFTFQNGCFIIRDISLTLLAPIPQNGQTHSNNSSILWNWRLKGYSSTSFTVITVIETIWNKDVSLAFTARTSCKLLKAARYRSNVLDWKSLNLKANCFSVDYSIGELWHKRESLFLLATRSSREWLKSFSKPSANM